MNLYTYINCWFAIRRFTDGSLSDTAVGLQGFDRSRRTPTQQRSPKSGTPTGERDRFGTGMGKKSNSTSQLSATGKLIHPHS